MKQEFIEKLDLAGYDRERLLKLMEDLDSEKRELRDAQRKFSNASYGQTGLAGKERFRKIGAMKTRVSGLIEEREIVKQRLGRIKEDEKSLNRSVSNRGEKFCHAFVAAAERILPEEQFIELELRAIDILDLKK